MIDDNDPRWAQHSGGEGHDGIEWAEGDEQLARHLHDSVGPNGRFILDLLIDNPGERLSADYIATQLNGGVTPSSAASGRHRVAASLITVGEQLAAQRRLPFYWWRGSNGDASLYAMKPSVAELFRNVRHNAAADISSVKQLSHRALAMRQSRRDP